MVSNFIANKGFQFQKIFKSSFPGKVHDKSSNQVVSEFKREASPKEEKKLSNWFLWKGESRLIKQYSKLSHSTLHCGYFEVKTVKSSKQHVKKT